MVSDNGDNCPPLMEFQLSAAFTIRIFSFLCAVLGPFSAANKVLQYTNDVFRSLHCFYLFIFFIVQIQCPHACKWGTECL